MPSGSLLIDDLEQRGLIQDHTDSASLQSRLDDAPVRLYCGFDPTADSLHVGNLQSIMLLRRFQVAGHAPIALVGGATGMIGDPGGRSEERQFLEPDVLDRNRAAIGAQLERFLDFDSGTTAARLVDNREWTERIGVLEFLRDVGKHMTINTMLAKESVKSRLDRESGISFTEFSYMLLQANDFLQLYTDHDCELQVAGSDQWGNITAGVDLIRRRTGAAVHGLTAPLILRADGTKFGKSEGENIWLSPDRTSPYRMYQYLLNLPDEGVDSLLLRLTLLSVEQCRELAAEHDADPSQRVVQRALARELTSLVHGVEVLGSIEAASAVLFGASLDEIDKAGFDLLTSEVDTTRVPRSELIGMDPGDLFAQVSSLAKSKGEYRRNLRGYYLNQVPMSDRGGDSAAAIGEADLLHGSFVLLRRGRTAHHLVVAV